MEDILVQRQTAIHLLRSGLSVKEVAQQLGRSTVWVYKCQHRYEQGQWAGLQERSRAPGHCPRQLPLEIRQAICQARSELEAEAAQKEHLSYVGAWAVQARLKRKGIQPLPSTASIERVLTEAGLTHPKTEGEVSKVWYPHLQPNQPHHLCQVDIVPHYLTGGQAVACFNALDVVSRYPTGQQFLHKRSLEAAQFLLHVWQEIGRPDYTQVDNEGCFSGGATHPGVLGRVVRLALWVGTELVFSAEYHPQSNGTVERFHQDYDQFVWDKTNLTDLAVVQTRSNLFFRDYRLSEHSSGLRGQSPTQVHQQSPSFQIAADFKLPEAKLPLTVGQVHFMRQVSPARTLSALNLNWTVPKAEPNQGVWVTLQLTQVGATLRIYDDAPDVPHRVCLAHHPFPLPEAVYPLRAEFQKQNQRVSLLSPLVTMMGSMMKWPFTWFLTMS